MIGQGQFPLEEIERTTYKDRDVWEITLSVPRELPAASAQTPISIALLGNAPIAYKRFLIDVETGDLVAIKIREFAAR